MKPITKTTTCFTFILFLFFINSCSSSNGKEPEITNPISLRFQFKLKSIPKELNGETISYLLKFYHCPNITAKDCYTPISIQSHKNTKQIQSSIDQMNFHGLAPNQWTHLSIRIEGIEKVYGKYSPGHNPFWIQNTDSFSKNPNITHEFTFVSQENLIPNRKQEELASKFAPILVFHKDKKYLPTNIEKYANYFQPKEYTLPNKDIRRKTTGQTTWNYVEFPDLNETEKQTHLYYHVRYANATVSGTQKEALPGFRDNGNYWYGVGNGDMVISYWIWYDWNEGPTKFGNIHQGDLESYALLVSKEGKPKRILLTGHDHILLDTDFRNINSLKNHPILYVAKGNMSSDGGNPTSAYGGYTVKLHAGNALFNYISDPWDVFPSFDPENSILIIPKNLSEKDLTNVKIGSGITDKTATLDDCECKDLPEPTRYVDARKMIKGQIERLVAWEEPGWVNQPADKDPDGHHKVDPKLSSFFKFQGRLGKHPRSDLRIRELHQYGESPENAPFKTNIEQHYTFESPKTDRSYTDREGNYGPKFLGDDSTPQK
ncbi:hypothetical protein EHQ16_04890 [Leptospira kanakyensis]|uniref:Lipoprotein n=1 Tax=Leptospira kanakyensis TaxID=2484968 RepID=A0A6N4PY81_9LEPT|nr:hypothetical protein [Leptospira kanakyensis]TGK50617.1 hypothetical protein EHQ11_13130 [Leptospira kanakyensis]TGK63782.1 hypothetical protein EHQ16_04890 [Leptospira kanakyensis]TGK69755.1 hypothetical protein EHQ18_13290 [Leptospira kanakyensis]